MYRRTVFTPDGLAVFGIESGTGTVNENSVVRVTGDAHPVPQGAPYSYKASYEGRLTHPAATLRGRQDWQIYGEPFVRNCTVMLERKSQK